MFGKGPAKGWVLQGKINDGLQITEFVAGIVSPALKLLGIHAALVGQGLQGIGELNFATCAGLHVF